MMRLLNPDIRVVRRESAVPNDIIRSHTAAWLHVGTRRGNRAHCVAFKSMVKRVSTMLFIIRRMRAMSFNSNHMRKGIAYVQFAHNCDWQNTHKCGTNVGNI